MASTPPVSGCGTAPAGFCINGTAENIWAAGGTSGGTGGTMLVVLAADAEPTAADVAPLPRVFLPGLRWTAPCTDGLETGGSTPAPPTPRKQCEKKFIEEHSLEEM